jgi:hypothetical protein
MNGQLASEALMAATEYVRGDANGLPTDDELIFLDKVREVLEADAKKPEPPKVKPSPFRKHLGLTKMYPPRMGSTITGVSATTGMLITGIIVGIRDKVSSDLSIEPNEPGYRSGESNSPYVIVAIPPLNKTDKILID